MKLTAIGARVDSETIEELRYIIKTIPKGAREEITQADAIRFAISYTARKLKAAKETVE